MPPSPIPKAKVGSCNLKLLLKPVLKVPNSKCERPLLNVAFNLNVRPYTKVGSLESSVGKGLSKHPRNRPFTKTSTAKGGMGSSFMGSATSMESMQEGY